MTAPRPLVALAAIALLATPLAGCIDDLAAPAGVETLDGGTNDERMSAFADVRNETGRRDGEYYVERVVTLRGDLAMERLAVTLATVNGDVRVSAGDRGEWRLVVTMTGEGRTAEEAQENFDRIRFTWRHEAGGEHFLQAKVEDRRRNGHSRGSWSGHLDLEVPPDVLLALDARTVNGDVTADGVRAETVRLEAVNGALDAAVSDSRTVALEVVNGKATAWLRPGASGSVTASVTNGNVDVRVPEGPSYGYDATASTTNGSPKIALKDGSGKTEGQFGPRKATFVTDGYASRAVRVTVGLTTVNGNVVLSPS